jgi:RNA polymerase sigma-70 factor (ECF subfamily)
MGSDFLLSFYLSMLDTAAEKEKFEQLYIRYKQDMFKTAYGILKNHHEAEDAVHDAFMIVIKKLSKISEVNCPQTHAYLLIIVKNLAIRIYNNRKNKPEEDSVNVDEIADSIDVEDEVVFNIKRKELERILLMLPENYYTVLFLEQYMGLSIADISDSLGISYENAKKRLQRAKTKFYQMIEECDTNGI